MKDFSHFHFWCQKVLPLVYDDSLSYYEVLCKLTSYIQNLIQNEQDLTSLIESLQADFESIQKEWPQFQNNISAQQSEFENTVKQELQQMQDTLTAIQNGEYIDLYLDSIKKYIDENVQTLVGNIVKYVVFGLSNDGHFVAYIPKSWDFLHFSTITDPDSDLYNHLVMTW